MTVRITPTDRGVAFNTYGADVTLTVGEDVFLSLGALSGCSVFPLTGERMPAGIASGQNRNVMFLFDLPEGLPPEAVLRIERVGETSVTLPAAAAVPETDVIAGEYAEAFPRGLKPLAQNPILAAIEGYTAHTLVLRESDGQLWMKLPGAGLAGGLTREGNVFRVDLSQGERKLAATVRVADGGRQVVVFFDEAFQSQLTFVRAGDTQAMMVLPLLNDNDREPWALGTPRPIEKPPADVKPPTTTQPYRPPGRSGGPTSIFDF